MRHKWISPFDLHEALMWRDKQKIKTNIPEEMDKSETILVRDTVRNGTENPLLISTKPLIRKELSSEREEKLQEREGYGGRWLSKNIRPKYGMLRRGQIRKVISEMWVGDEEIEVDLG